MSVRLSMKKPPKCGPAGLRDGIESAGVKGMTSENSPEPEPGPLHGAMTPDGFDGILRTGGEKTAGCREKGRQDNLVTADQADKHPGDGVLYHGVRNTPFP